MRQTNDVALEGRGLAPMLHTGELSKRPGTSCAGCWCLAVAILNTGTVRWGKN